MTMPMLRRHVVGMSVVGLSSFVVRHSSFVVHRPSSVEGRRTSSVVAPIQHSSPIGSDLRRRERKSAHDHQPPHRRQEGRVARSGGRVPGLRMTCNTCVNTRPLDDGQHVAGRSSICPHCPCGRVPPVDDTSPFCYAGRHAARMSATLEQCSHAMRRHATNKRTQLPGMPNPPLRGELNPDCGTEETRD